jgi:GDP-L-fucose synthase
MNKNSKIFVAGHNGLVGSTILTKLQKNGYNNIITQTKSELDLTNQQTVNNFFSQNKPEYVFLAAAKVGGILANNTYRADFIYQNLQIQNNVIHASYVNNVKKLLFLGSSCIYPKNSPQPIKEEYLLTDELEYTNEPYAIAKIAGIKMCESYNIQYKTNFISVMPTNLYGNKDNFDLNNSHVIPGLIRKIYLAKLYYNNKYDKIGLNLGINANLESISQILTQYGIIKNSNNVIINLWGSGNPMREFLHVNDMADACIFIMNTINFTDLVKDKNYIKNTHINIGSAIEICIRDLAIMIAEIIGFEGLIQFDNKHPDGTMRKLSDVTKLNKLGWIAKINLNEGLKSVINNYINEVK